MGDTWRHTKDFLAGRMSAEAMMRRLERDLPHTHPDEREQLLRDTRNSVIVYFEKRHGEEMPKEFVREFDTRSHDIQRWKLLDQAEKELAKSGGPMTKERFDGYLERGKDYHAQMDKSKGTSDGASRLQRLEKMLIIGAGLYGQASQKPAEKGSEKQKEPTQEVAYGHSAGA